ncbi:MAG: PAS domain S-box protein [Candidatus Hydrothermarchaeales archaeon]
MAKTQILVVEDERIVAEDIKRTLQNLGYVVPSVVSSGKEALKKAEEYNPDLVLMDIVLQGKINGIDAASQIRSRFNIPVVYLTAYADEKTLERARITEPFGYIIKPFEDRELRATIEMALYKHRIEKRLKESEEWLSTTLRSIGDALIATDTEGRVIFLNPVAQALTGWKHKAAVGKPLKEVFNIINEETGGKVENPVSRVIREGVVVGLANHTILIAKDGTKRPIDDSGAPIKDEKGNIIGVVLVFHDITDRKKAEEKLIESETHLRTIIESEPECVKLVAAGGTILDMNPAGLAMVEADSKEEVVGKSVYPLIAKEYRPAFKALNESVFQGKSRTLEFEIVGLKGTRRWLESRAVPLRDAKGKITAQLAVTRDISEPKKLEQIVSSERDEFNFILQQLPVGISVLDAEDKFVYINPISMKIDQYKEDISDLIGKDVRSVHPKPTIPKIDRLLHDFKSGERSFRSREAIRKGGKKVEISYHAIRSRKGKYQGAIRLVSDITERKKAEEVLIESEEKYRSLFSHMTNAFAYHKMVFDNKNRPVDYVFLEVNDAFEKNTGLKREDVIGKKVTEIIPGIKDVEPDLISIYGKVALTKEDTRFDLYFEPFDRWYSVSAYSPEKGYFVTVLDEITKRKRAEEDLRESEENLSLIYETAGDVLFQIEVEPNDIYRFLSVNNTFLTATGLTEDQIVGKTIDEVIPEPSLALVRGNYQRAIREKKTVQWEETSEYPTGVKVGDVTITPAYNKEGKCTHLIGSVHDITERKRAEEMLTESEEKFRGVVESSKDAIITVDENDRIIVFNKAAEEMFGFKPEEVFGKTQKIFIPPEYLEQHARGIKRFFKTGKGKFIGKTLELEALRKDKERFPIELTLFTFKTRKRRFVTTIIRDITERKKAEEELKKQTRLSQLFMDSIPCIALLLKKESREIVASNIEARKIGAVSGKKCYEVWGPSEKSHPFCLAPKLWKTGKAQHLIVEAYGVVWEAYWIPVDDEVYLHYAFDITDRKKVEDEIRHLKEFNENIVQTMEEGILIEDENGIITFVNPKTEKRLGYSKEELIGKHWKDISSPRYIEKMEEETAKRPKGISSSYEVTILSKTGDEIPILISASPFFEGDIFKGVLAVFTDIREQKLTEEKLKTAYEELKTIDETKTNIISNVSHELKTPLTIALATIGFAKTEEDLGRVKEHLKTIKRALLRQNLVVEDLIEASTFEKKTQRFEMEPVQLNDLIIITRGELLPFAEKLNIKIESQLASDLPMVKADFKQIKTALRNLVMNAIKFSKEKEGEILIKTTKKKDIIEVSISDKGIGIPEKHHEKIFEKLYQVESSKDRKYKGTGIGLALTKEIITAHGGKISLKSKPSKGSTFIFTLPSIKEA